MPALAANVRHAAHSTGSGQAAKQLQFDWLLPDKALLRVA